MKNKIEANKNLENAEEQKYDQKDLKQGYTYRAIPALLQAYSIAQGPKGNMSCDEIHPLDVYFYPFQGLQINMLLEDNIQYFLSQKEIRPRRVAFLLLGANYNQAFALIIQPTDLSKEAAEKLRQTIHQLKLDNVEDIRNNPLVLKQFKGLYRHLHCLFIGSPASSDLINQLKPLIQQAYTARVQLDCLALPNNSEVILTEYILSMFKNGKTTDVDVPKTLMSHHQQCLSVFIKALEMLKYKKDPNYPVIQEILIRIFKFAALEQKRNELKIMPRTAEEMEQLLTNDRQLKKIIYCAEVNGLIDYVKHFNIDFLAHCIGKESHALLEIFTKISEAHYQRILKWQDTWQEQIKKQDDGWLQKIWRRAKNVTQEFYQNSLVAFGAELIHWVGQPVVTLVKNVAGKNVVRGLKDFAERSVKWTVFALTLSPRLADNSLRIAKKIIIAINISYALKAMGAGLGLVYSYSLGTYGLARMTIVSLGALKMSEYLKNESLNDKKAEWTSRPNTMSPSVILRILTLSLTFIETVYARQSSYFVKAMGGVAGSVGLTHFAKRWWPELRQAKTDDEVFSLFLLSTAGHDIGYGLTNFALETWSNLSMKQAARSKVLEELKKFDPQNRLDIAINPSLLSQLLDPRFWFNEENPMEIDWHDIQGFSYQMHCQSRALSSNTVQMNCTSLSHGVPRLTNS